MSRMVAALCHNLYAETMLVGSREYVVVWLMHIAIADKTTDPPKNAVSEISQTKFRGPTAAARGSPPPLFLFWQ
jgi:hypothetical protein